MPQNTQVSPTRNQLRAQRNLLDQLTKAKARIAELEKANAAMTAKLAAVPAAPAAPAVPATTQVIPPAKQADLAAQSKTA